MLVILWPFSKAIGFLDLAYENTRYILKFAFPISNEYIFRNIWPMKYLRHIYPKKQIIPCLPDLNLSWDPIFLLAINIYSPFLLKR